ncbi:hypothetical protein [Kordiimonas aestuarii]|uniref:hypothetical protein n=1 Tax=Kordiimonas aestuarii TaxID=1005925 RepID=UPI0021D1A804|nr:hypothetical protein [Kordiimonas aestuarii]
MPQLSPVLVLLGLALALAGVMVLRYTWGKKGARSRAEVSAGWGLIAASFVPWVMASTPDWGSALAICLFMIIGVVLMGYAAARQPEGRKARAGRAERAAAPASAVPFNWPITGRRVFTFLLAGPIAGVAALYLCLWLYGAMGGGASAGQLMAVLFAFPLLWAVLSVFATYDMPVVRRGGIVVLSGVLGALGTYFVI